MYSSLSLVMVIKPRRMRWAGHVVRMEVGRYVYGVLVGRPESRSPLAIPRCRWENNNKMELMEIGINLLD
jgi:hypothetical protein